MADVNPNAALSEEDIQFLETRTGPIPGQSLTNNTDNKYPWEQPPMFTNRREAEVYILEELTTPESFIAITDILADDIPVDIVARTYLYSGYNRGLWNVDLMLLLAESTMFILMALAEKLDIDYELYAGDKAEDGIDPDNQEQIFDKANDVLKKQIRKIDSGDVKPPAFMNKEIEEKLEAIPEETVEQAKSLLSPDEEEPKQSESLLGV